MMIGASHRNTTLDKLADFIVRPDRQIPLIESMLQHTEAEEAVLLVTCNRCEIYMAVEHYDEDIRHRFAALATGKATPDISCLRTHLGRDAVRHLLRVAGGCEAMIIGETQILGQVKDAYRRARQHRHAGSTLSRLFDYALSTAKRVRQQADLERHSDSFASAALRLAGHLFEDLRKKNVLFIGTGDMIRTIALQFDVRGFEQCTVAGRSPDKTHRIADEIDGRAISIPEALENLYHYDIVVSCTAADTPVVSREAVRRAVKKRRHRTLCLIDLALPHDIEPTATSVSDAYLFNLNHLSELIAGRQHKHRKAGETAMQLIEESLRDYDAQTRVLAVTDLIKAWRNEAEDMRAELLTEALKQLQKDGNPEDIIRRFSGQLTNKLLHPITTLLKHAAETDNALIIKYLQNYFDKDKE